MQIVNQLLTRRLQKPEAEASVGLAAFKTVGSPYFFHLFEIFCFT